MAGHVPQALGALSPSLARRSASQTDTVAKPAAERRGKSSHGRLAQPRRNLRAEPGIKRTGLAEARTEPKWVSHRDGPPAERLGLGASADCGFVWRNAGKSGVGAHQSVCQYRLSLGLPRSYQRQDEALVQRPHLWESRPRPPR